MGNIRRVQGLRKVELMDSGPWSDKPTLRGRAAEGIRYQKQAHEALGMDLQGWGPLFDGPWIRFTDSNGVHWCQPDTVLEAYDRVLVAEMKLSQRRLDTAIVQLTKLYKPTLRLLFGKPVVMLAVFKNWIPGGSDLPIVDEPKEMLTRPLGDLGSPLGWNFI